jgi:hypothetical protein
METKLKNIKFIYDEEVRELLIEKDKVYFAVPKRYMGSLQIFLNRVYRKYFNRRPKHV